MHVVDLDNSLALLSHTLTNCVKLEKKNWPEKNQFRYSFFSFAWREEIIGPKVLSCFAHPGSGIVLVIFYNWIICFCFTVLSDPFAEAEMPPNTLFLCPCSFAYTSVCFVFFWIFHTACSALISVSTVPWFSWALTASAEFILAFFAFIFTPRQLTHL